MPNPSLLEKFAALAGRSTFRLPMGGAATRPGELPWTHELASALAMSRAGPNDVGPDIVCSIATGTHAHRQRIVMQLAASLLATGGRVADRHADHLLEVAAHAYLRTVHSETPEPLVGMPERDYDLLVWQGGCLLERSASAALRRASAVLR